MHLVVLYAYIVLAMSNLSILFCSFLAFSVPIELIRPHLWLTDLSTTINGCDVRSVSYCPFHPDLILSGGHDGKLKVNNTYLIDFSWR